MVSFKSKQIFIAVYLMASLFVGSAAACACSHHASEPEKSEAGSSSCHSHQKNTEVQQADTDADCFENGDGCICAANAQRMAAKSEAIKLKKHLTTIAQQPATEIVTRELLIATSTSYVLNEFYLSDSFYNLAPKRGPPRA